MPIRTINRHLTAYHNALNRGDLSSLRAAAQDRDWIEDLMISTEERRATMAFLDELVEHLSRQPNPDTGAAMSAIDNARSYWRQTDRYRS